jgi:hypothetical protein
MASPKLVRPHRTSLQNEFSQRFHYAEDCGGTGVHPQVQTIKTLCESRCDVNMTATTEDIAGGLSGQLGML